MCFLEGKIYIYSCTFPKFITRTIANMVEATAIYEDLFYAIYVDDFISPLKQPHEVGIIFFSSEFTEVKTEPQKANPDEHHTVIK